MDEGNVSFALDRSTGFVIVTVRPPFALPTAAVKSRMHVFDLLEVAAKIQLQVIADNRAPVGLVANKA